MNVVSKSISFLRESRLEISKVNWPSREQTIKHTIAVIVFSLAVAAILGSFDVLFMEMLERFILR